MELSEREECVVSGALGVLLRVSRWTGTAPLRMQRLHSGTYRIRFHRPLHIIACIIWVFFNSISLYWIVTLNVIPQLIEGPVGKHTPWALIDICNMLVVTAISCVAVCCGDRRMKKLISIVHYMQEHMHKIDVVKPKTRKPWMVILSYVAMYSFVIAYDICTNSLCYFIFLLQINFILIAAVQEVFFNVTLYLYVKALNTELQEMSRSRINATPKREQRPVLTLSQHFRRTVKPLKQTIDLTEIGTAIYTVSKGHANRKLAELAKAYIAICNVAYNEYKSEGALLIMLISTHATGTFVDVFNLLSSTKDLHVDTMSFYVHVCWVLVHITTLIGIIEPCHRLQREMALTKAKLSQVICRDDISKDMQNDLDDFFMMLLLPAPCCFPMGLCPLNRSFLASMSAVGTSLLILILQFNLTERP